MKIFQISNFKKICIYTDFYCLIRYKLNLHRKMEISLLGLMKLKPQILTYLYLNQTQVKEMLYIKQLI